MRYYTTIRCKCIVKQKYRQLIADSIALISDKADMSIENQYIQELLNNGSGFFLYFYNKNKWYETVEEDPINYSFSVDTGEWQFHIAINNEIDEVEEFLVRFNPYYLEKINFLEIYDENSIEGYLNGRYDSYLLTDFFIQDLINDWGEYWRENILID